MGVEVIGVRVVAGRLDKGSRSIVSDFEEPEGKEPLVALVSGQMTRESGVPQMC
jgi:hypothetical protein